jgi:hypothetical protein
MDTDMTSPSPQMAPVVPPQRRQLQQQASQVQQANEYASMGQLEQHAPGIFATGSAPSLSHMAPFTPVLPQPLAPTEPPPSNESTHLGSLEVPPENKKRFRMGPRTDCEKCRLGVPGHYAHFD